MAHWTQHEKDLEQEVKKLIVHLTGIEDEEEDEEDQNFQMALKFAWSNFRFHRFLDVSSHKVQRSIKGVYEKLMIHSDVCKAESWMRLTSEFLSSPLPHTEGCMTDVHHSILFLLLLLSDSPSNTSYTERPRLREAEKEDKIDWAKYLMEGEDVDTGPFPDTPEWSEDESEEEESQQLISREDSGIQVDKTPQEDQQQNDKMVQVTWAVGEPDSRAWLERHVVTPYWVPHSSRFPHSLHLHSNLLNVWDQHLYNTDPLYLPEEKTFVTETQVIRETLWLLSGVKRLFIFQHHDGKIGVRNDVVVTHLTNDCLRSVLEHVAAYGQAVFRLQKFIDEVSGHSTEPCPPGLGTSSSSSSKKSSEPPFRTYQAFVWALYKYFSSFKEELAAIERDIISKDETVTLSAVLERLSPHLAQITVLHRVFCTGVAEVPSGTPDVVRASHLLNTLYKAIIEYDSVGEASEQAVALLFSLWVETVRPYLEIVDEWIVHGHLFDPAKEFIIQRNKDVPVNHRDFWYATYTLYSVSEAVDSEERLSDTASGSSGGDQSSSSRQNTMVSFLKPVLKQIIMAGKSMQLLKNLDCKEAEQAEGSSRVWRLFRTERATGTNSLHWLLQEPLIYGARLDIADSALTHTLQTSGLITLGRLVDLAGPELKDAGRVAARLGSRSLRIVARLLQRWNSALSPEEQQMLVEYCGGAEQPDEEDPFPELSLSPDLEGSTGHFLECRNVTSMDFYMVSGKMFYKACVKVFNRNSLNGRVDTPWRSVLGLREEERPQWRSLYKPPLTKRTGDLQWRILHGIIAVNAFISVLCPETSHKCPFCLQRETIFHTFTQCLRLKPLFTLLQTVFNAFNKSFSVQTFILGVKYTKKRQAECQLLNFVVGQAKMGIYISRKNKVEQRGSDDARMVTTALMKSRILVDFHFYKKTANLAMFEKIWCINNALCSVFNDELHFAQNMY